MDSESWEVTASHIDRLKSIIFPSRADHEFRRPSVNNVSQPNTRQFKNGNDCQPSAHRLQRSSDSELPSVVQESQDITVGSDRRSEHYKFLSPDAIKRLQVMASQGEPANCTQLISQSIYDSIIKKSRSSRDAHSDEQTETQRTFEHGDSGHIDITSSFVTRHEQPDDLADSEPIELSPVQSQNQLTQFPESQRFKTPATAGKKRTYNGDVVETPVPVRNPLARHNQGAIGGTLGLSQAFAATQAASSPISNGLPTGPRSDRPSPVIELQTRPVNAASSSPLLRPITELKRAATEPAARYVSMKQSQAERERQERLHILQRDSSGDAFDDDDFEEENSLVARKRRQRIREEKAKQELKSLSSPLLPPRELPTSSPPKLALRDEVSDRYAQSLPNLSPSEGDDLVLDNALADIASEAETEQDVDEQIAVSQSSRANRIDEEDKENSSVLVPKTGPRSRLNLAMPVPQVDASPSLRHTNHPSTAAPVIEPQSSEPFRIMDSQPSQSRSRFRSSTKYITSSASDKVDVAEHTSTTDPIVIRAHIDTGTGRSQLAESAKRSVIRWPEDDVDDVAPIAESVTTTTRNDTVPETSSDAREGAMDGISVLQTDLSTNKEPTAPTETTFETAPTHGEHNATSQSSPVSSPVHTTPPGRKRRRMMMDISAEPTPRKLQSQPSFDAGVVLQLDEDQEAADVLESSLRHSRAISTNANYGIISHSAPTKSEVVTTEAVDISPEVSQDVVRPGRLSRSQFRGTTSPIAQEEVAPSSSLSRRSIFDIQASPQQPVLTKSRGRLTSAINGTGRKKSGSNGNFKSKIERRLQPETTAHKPTHSSFDLGGYADPDIRPSALEVSGVVRPDDMSVHQVIAPDMVLAYYRGDPRGYYPARVLGLGTGGHYIIQWDGYEPEEIDSYGVKALDVRVGDTVKVLADGFRKIPYIIQGFKDRVTEQGESTTDIRGFKTLVVVPKQRPTHAATKIQDTTREVPITSMYLDINMWAQMKSRNQEFKPMTDPSITPGIATPLIRASTPNTPSSRNRRPTTTLMSMSTPIADGIFNGMAFAISYEDSAQKNTLGSLIQGNGGRVIHESFDELLELDSIQLKAQYMDFGFTALLTDRHSRKEKYMQALALNLPCLSGRWIEACIRHGILVDWQLYLLPAGESEELDNATKSRILPVIDISKARLVELLQTRLDLLSDAAVVVVTGRGKAETKRAPYLFLIRAIGAHHIHKVPDLKSAKDFLGTDEGKTCRWIFVDDKDVTTMKSLLSETGEAEKTRGRPRSKTMVQESELQVGVAGNELIVQSLILGKLYEG